MLTCECGFTTYSGYLQEFEYLTQRRQWLWDRVVEQSGPPDPATARQYAVWPAPRQPFSATSATAISTSCSPSILMIGPSWAASARSTPS